MRRELDYIENDRAALHWALGCVIASYKLRLAARMSGARRRDILRQAAASAALMLVTGLVLLENAGGQTAPRSPVLDETACDMADKGRNPELKSDRTLPAVPLHPGLDAGRPAPTSEMACAGRNAPVDVLPRYDTP
jgi:hypothetical protein